MAVEISSPVWVDIAERLFGADYPDEGAFRKAFESKLSLYHRLAEGVLRNTIIVSVDHIGGISGSFLSDTQRNNIDRVAERVDTVIDAAAYAMMSEAFAIDAANGNERELMNMVNQYEGVIAGR